MKLHCLFIVCERWTAAAFGVDACMIMASFLGCLGRLITDRWSPSWQLGASASRGFCGESPSCATKAEVCTDSISNATYVLPILIRLVQEATASLWPVECGAISKGTNRHHHHPLKGRWQICQEMDCFAMLQARNGVHHLQMYNLPNVCCPPVAVRLYTVIQDIYLYWYTNNCNLWYDTWVRDWSTAWLTRRFILMIRIWRLHSSVALSE